MKYKTKSVMIGRKPAKDEDSFKTALIALFEENNAHKSGKSPTQVLEYENIEKVRIRGLNTSYYLEGNDLVINDLKEIEVEIEGNMIVLTGKQS